MKKYNPIPSGRLWPISAFYASYSMHCLFCLTVLIGVFLYSGKSQPPATYYSFATEFEPNEKYVALTFDDGPHGVLTPRLLDSLSKFTNDPVKITLFVMGIKVVMHPNIVKRAHEEGHEIGNHVWDHPVLAKLPWDEVFNQMNKTSNAIYNAIGVHPKVMRPPYGNTRRPLNERIYNTFKQNVIMWTLDTLDWKRPSVEQIVKKAVDNTKPGTIILCHDIHPGTIEAIPKLVEALQRKGFKFRTVSEVKDWYEKQTSNKK